MKAPDVLSTAADLIVNKRAEQHGDKRTTHENIAEAWTTWLQAVDPLTGYDAAMMMAHMKIARTRSGTFNTDDFVDACAYLAIACELRAGDD